MTTISLHKAIRFGLVFSTIILPLIASGCANSPFRAANFSKTADTMTVLNWTEDFEAAMKYAQTNQKLVLAEFTGSDWCTWCHKLEDEVFHTEPFQNWAAENVVLLKLDFPKKVS